MLVEKILKLYIIEPNKLNLKLPNTLKFTWIIIINDYSDITSIETYEQNLIIYYHWGGYYSSKIPRDIKRINLD